MGRICTFGVPRLWAAFWMACCLYVGLLVMVGLGFTWLRVLAGAWMLGPWALMGLTLFDAQWDDIVIAQLSRRYKAYYDAG